MFASPVAFNRSLEVFTPLECIDRLFPVVEASEVPIASFRIDSSGYWMGFA